MKEFKLRFKESQDFFILVSAIKALLDKATIELDTEKFHLFGIDPSHIVKVDLELSKKYFDNYEMSYSQEFSIELELLNTIMKRANKEQLTLSANIKENKLICFFKSETSEREFALGILSEPVESKLGTAQDLEHPDSCNFDLDTELLSRSLKDLSIFKDWAEFTLDSDKLIANAIGDNGNAIISMNVNININGTKQVSMYSLEYLKDIMKARPLADIVNISFRNEMPIILDFKFKEGRITYILAPRVEEDKEPEGSKESEESEDESDDEEYPETEVIGK